MCFWKPNPVFTEPVDFRLISATINDYPGDVNDLRGCNNDGRLAKETVLGHWPTANTHRLMDCQATVSAVTSSISDAVSFMKPDGVICVLADSCFSGEITKMFMGIVSQKVYNMPKFYHTPGVAPVLNYPLFQKETRPLRWISIGGCGKVGYSADAFINGDYQGAFTYYAMKTLKPWMTYRQWYSTIRAYLPSGEFDQVPTLSGPEYLLDQVIGANQTLWIHNSSHGTQLNGTQGDAVDEALCLYNGNLRDKDYFNLLNKLAA
jgi:hypothetical protein